MLDLNQLMISKLMFGFSAVAANVRLERDVAELFIVHNYGLNHRIPSSTANEVNSKFALFTYFKPLLSR